MESWFWQYQIIPLSLLQSLTFTHVLFWGQNEREKHGILSNLKCYSQLCFSGPVGLVSETHRFSWIGLFCWIQTQNKRINKHELIRSTDTPPPLLTLTSQISEQNWRQAYCKREKYTDGDGTKARVILYTEYAVAGPFQHQEEVFLLLSLISYANLK